MSAKAEPKPTKPKTEVKKAKAEPKFVDCETCKGSGLELGKASTEAQVCPECNGTPHYELKKKGQN